ncbi:MAG: MaoC domain protein dehydratase, partial [Verrucomicrobiaceae bacterium]|nr:MaoC domain protein dehydratase [Verrucomicrobiaceae bacterium]
MIDRFRPGMVFSEEVTLSPALVESFAQFSGDRNPLHLQADSAREYGFARPVAHGAIQSAIVSRLIGMKVPGPGAVWMSQSMEWMRPAFVGDTIRVEAEIESVSAGAETLSLILRATNQQNEELMKGTAKVKVATKLAEDTSGANPKEPRVALVTGGSRGIGAAIAKALAAAGMEVAVACKSNRTAAALVVQQIISAGGRAQCYVSGLEETGSAAALVQQVQADFGRLDVIVHAATQPVLPLSVT